MTARQEGGFAAVAALLALMAFSAVAFAVLETDRGAIAAQLSLVTQARLSAAADAGLAMAVDGLSSSDRTTRWPIDSSTRIADFDGIRLAITVEDERGKIPINAINEDQARAMFTAAGVPDEQLAAVTDAYFDWIDVDNDRRPNGAEAADYAGTGIVPTNGPLRSIDELREIRGVTPLVFSRLKPAVTLFFGNSGAFSPSTAQPLALAVMSGKGAGSVDVIERQRELAGQRAAGAITEDQPLAARALTVRVSADGGAQGRLDRATIIEFLDASSRRWAVRWRE